MGARSLPALVRRIRYPAAPHDETRTLGYSGAVLGVVAAAYWFTGWPLPRLTSTNPNLDFYLVQPLVWLSVAVAAYHGWCRLAGAPPFEGALTGFAFGVGAVHVAALAVAGLVAGFVDSPVAGRIANYPRNLLFILTLLAGVETARAYLYHAWQRRDDQWAFVLTALVFWAVTVPAAQWTAVDSVDRYQRIIGGRWLPALAVSLLATWLVKVGGIGPSFTYRLALLGFEWLSPELPNLGWQGLLAVGVISPLAGAFLVRRFRAERTPEVAAAP